MNNVIMSTKNTTTSRKNVAMVLSVLIILIGIFVVGFYIFANEHTRNNNVIMILFLGLFFIGDGIIMLAKNYINGSTYVDVYNDRFIGKGIQNLSALNFNIKLEEINNISVEGTWIHIHTSSGMYKVMTDKTTATKIFNYYIELKG